MEIKRYFSQERIQNANAYRAGQARSAAEFMSPGQQAMPGALQQLAQGMDKLNAVVVQEDLRKRNELMELDLLRDMQTLQDEAATWQDEYQQQYRGRDAVNAETDARAWYKEKLDALNQRWSGNTRALTYIQRQAGGLALSGIDGMRDYGNQQHEAYKDSVFATDTERFKAVASDWRSTPEQIDAAYQDFLPRHIGYLQSKGQDSELARMKTAAMYRDTMDAHREAKLKTMVQSGDIAGAQAELDALQAGDPAAFAARRESGAVGGRAIGYDTTGGTSYGTYQISSDTMPGFIAYLEKYDPEAAAKLKQAGPANTGSRKGKMPEVWQKLADENPAFADLQKDFIQKTHVEPVLNSLGAEARAVVESNQALSCALWSTGIQHGPGGGKRLFKEAWEKSGGTPERFIEYLYEARKEKFGSSTPEVQASVQARLEEEKRTLLEMSRTRPAKIAGYQQLIQTAGREQEKAQRAQLVQAEYAKLPALVQGRPFEEWDHIALSAIAKADVPREVGLEVKKLWEQEKAFRQDEIKANDARLVSELLSEFQGLSPGMIREKVNERRPDLLQKGLSPHEGFKLLDQRLKDADVETPKNIASMNAIYKRIAEGALDGMDSDRLRSLAYASGLTEEQTQSIIKFKEGGGQLGMLKDKNKIIQHALDFYADNEKQRKKIEESDYLKALAKVLPIDKPPTDADIYKQVGNLFKHPDLMKAAKKAGTDSDKLGQDLLLWRPSAGREAYARVEAHLRDSLKREPTEDEVLLYLRKEMGVRGGVSAKSHEAAQAAEKNRDYYSGLLDLEVTGGR